MARKERCIPAQRLDLNALFKGFDDAQLPFEAATAPDMAIYQGVHATVERNYDFACAMTGVKVSDTDTPDARLRVSVIRPRPAGGGLHASNFLLLCPAAAEAFAGGQISIGPSYHLLADLGRIDPELLKRLNPDGRLRLPGNKTGRPDGAALQFHRETMFSR